VPDRTFAIDEQFYQRLGRRFERELALWDAGDDIHMVMMATFGIAAASAHWRARRCAASCCAIVMASPSPHMTHRSVGTKLPTEAEFGEQFGVSRIVVRETLANLVRSGLIYRIRVQGAFVSARERDEDFVATVPGSSDAM
jgi:hypothetical protein